MASISAMSSSSAGRGRDRRREHQLAQIAPAAGGPGWRARMPSASRASSSAGRQAVQRASHPAQFALDELHLRSRAPRQPPGSAHGRLSRLRRAGDAGFPTTGSDGPSPFSRCAMAEKSSQIAPDAADQQVGDREMRAA